MQTRTFSNKSAVAETSARISTVMLSPSALVNVASSSPRMFSRSSGNYLGRRSESMVGSFIHSRIEQTEQRKSENETDNETKPNQTHIQLRRANSSSVKIDILKLVAVHIMIIFHRHPPPPLTNAPKSCRTISWMSTSASVLKSRTNRELADSPTFSCTSSSKRCSFWRTTRAIFAAFSEAITRDFNSWLHITMPDR